MAIPRDIRKRSSLSGLFGGRTLAIAIAVALSAGCFTLGYLVGQANTERQAVTEIISVPEQGKVVVEVQPATPIEQATAAEAPATDTLKPTEDTPAAAPVEQTAKKATDKKQADAKPKAADAKTSTAKPAAAKPAEEKIPVSSVKPASTGANYSVQVGALSSLADADAFKRKLEGLGYTEIVIFRDKDMSGKTVFKVKVGSFETRDSADQMLIRLKNRDKINGFITTVK